MNPCAEGEYVMFRKTAALLLAVSLLAFSVSAAGASGLFREMMDTEYSDERLAVLDQAAETVSESMTEGSVTVEISQAYYEGNRVYLSYRASSRILEQDGLTLSGGAYADIIAGGSVEKEDGSVIGWKECIVPEDELADTQVFFLCYRIPETNEAFMLGVPLKRHAYRQTLQGASSAAGYQARATLYAGKADLKGTVILASQEQASGWLAWQEGLESAGTDVIACWNLYQNGKLVSGDLDGASEVLPDGVAFSIMFPYMEDLSGLALVPEYSDAGERTDEAIVLEPREQD